MSSQHLSDEAVAAAADGVLTGHARDRATKHLAGCAECADAVRVQREAAWALRTAPPPALPNDLLDRLRSAVGDDELPQPLSWYPAPQGTYLPLAAPIAALGSPRGTEPGAERDADGTEGGHGWLRSLFPTGLFRSGPR